MVFKHNEQTFAINELDQLAYEPWRQLEIDGELAAFPELSPLRSEKLAIDGRQENFSNSHLENLPVESSYDVHGGSMNEVVSSEHSKRPLDDDEDHPLASKRPKQLDTSVHLGSPVLAYNFLGSPSDAKATHMDPDFLRSSFPFYFDEGCLRAGDMCQSLESSSSCIDDYPRKLVAIGPNHQAVIPEWRSNGYKNCHGYIEDFNAAATSSLSYDVKADEDDGKMTGTCIMPMPDTSLISHTGVLQQKMDCSCPDERSFRCVRQHITEVGEKLEKAIGHDRFVDLGFCDMGEYVAEKWTGEEEHLFQQVVLSNPASLGKNFWDYLPRVFPSRSSKEFVSYYFNVFMLRKRAEQNRFDPLNIDSDDDEWQESDDGRCAAEEDEEDSAVESPADQEDANREKDDNEEFDVDEDTEYDESEEYVMVKDNEGRVSATSACDGNNEVQDDSCTSFEAKLNGVNFSGDFLDNVGNQHGFTEGHKNLPRNDDFSVIDHVFLEGHCGPKVWDICFTHGEPKDELLSTCNVIEEFGKEGWKSNPINSHGFSHF